MTGFEDASLFFLPFQLFVIPIVFVTNCWRKNPPPPSLPDSHQEFLTAKVSGIKLYCFDLMHQRSVHEMTSRGHFDSLSHDFRVLEEKKDSLCPSFDGWKGKELIPFVLLSFDTFSISCSILLIYFLTQHLTNRAIRLSVRGAITFTSKSSVCRFVRGIPTNSLMVAKERKMLISFSQKLMREE